MVSFFWSAVCLGTYVALLRYHDKLKNYTRSACQQAHWTETNNSPQVLHQRRNWLTWVKLSFHFILRYNLNLPGLLCVAAYMPHLSLLYGDLTEEEKKAAQQKANCLDPTISSLSFPSSRLALYRTNPDDKTCLWWEKVAECTLSSTWCFSLTPEQSAPLCDKFCEDFTCLSFF